MSGVERKENDLPFQLIYFTAQLSQDVRCGLQTLGHGHEYIKIKVFSFKFKSITLV